jgi:hypothetical protein
MANLKADRECGIAIAVAVAIAGRGQPNAVTFLFGAELEQIALEGFACVERETPILETLDY